MGCQPEPRQTHIFAADSSEDAAGFYLGVEMVDHGDGVGGYYLAEGQLPEQGSDPGARVRKTPSQRQAGQGS
jgi:hypothetical protein